MSIKVVHRPARVTRPLERPTPRDVTPPPPLPPEAAGSLPAQLLLPVMGAMSSVIMMTVMRNGQPIYLIVAAAVFLVAIGSAAFMAFSSRGHAYRQRNHVREVFLDHLEEQREQLARQTDDLRMEAAALDPEPATLAAVVADPTRLWERRSRDDDFLQLRVGTAAQDWFGLHVPAAPDPTQPYDPVLLEEQQRTLRERSIVPDLPVAIDCNAAGEVVLLGDRAAVLDAARSLAMQAGAFHSPDDLELALVAGPDSIADWTGFDFFPHAINARLFDGPVPARRIAPTLPALSRVLGGELLDRVESASRQRRSGGVGRVLGTRLLIFVDCYGEVAPTLHTADTSLSLRELGITLVYLVRDRIQEPSQLTTRVTFDADRRAVVEHFPVSKEGVSEAPDEPVRDVVGDQAAPALLGALARQLCPLRLRRQDAAEAEEAQSMSTNELLGISGPDDIDLDRLWKPRSPADFLRVPIGLDDHGAPVLLDLKESAQMGMGPHGITIGATGSGKSEMLRTLVLGLAMNHPPEDLSMILVDYKGGAAFSPFARLPHVAGLIDNLAEDAQLTVRARASIQGEVVRRQQQLKDAGHLSSITHYRELRRQGADLPPMPHLFVVIDEFGELLTAEPEFSELFLQIGRIGRSIGVHLLLSSQRIESGKLRGLDTYLSYRLGLRTFSESESQVVLDTPDAFHLPPIPGFGYLKVDTSVYRRFRSGYVSGPVERVEAPERDEDDDPTPLVLPDYNTLASDSQGTDADGDSETQLTEPEVGRTLVEACVEGLEVDASRVVRPVWLPPLPARLGLNRVLSEAASTSEFAAIIGLIDDPAHQGQDPWQLDLTKSGGHVAVIGAPQSGKSMFLRTLTVSLAHTHTPREVSIYGMDLTGGGLGRLEGFPHVGGIAIRSHADRLRRVVEELGGMLAMREAVFQRYGVESMSHLRQLHAAGRIPELTSADIVVLIDGYGSLRQDFEELLDAVNELISRGSSYGLHFVVTLARFGELRMAQQAEFGTRVELRLNDPSDSIIDRKLSVTIAADLPGRALTDGKLFAHVALPSLDEVDDESIGEAIDEAAQRSAESWRGPAAAPVRLLPTHLDPAVLLGPDVEPDAIPYGVRQDSMENALFEFQGADQHLLVFGDTRSGKSTALRTLTRGFLDRFTSDELVIAVMDPRSTVAPVIPEPYLGAHARSPRDARALAASMAGELDTRANSTPEENAASPRIVLIVDDYDILDAGGTDPLAPLLPHLPSARDLRFNVILARPVAGVSRALYGQVLQSLRDTGGSTLLLSGDRSEGQIFPRIYAQPFPPGRGQFVRRAERPFIVQCAEEPDR